MMIPMAFGAFLYLVPMRRKRGAQPTYGEYDSEYVFADTIPSKYTCFSCSNILHDAYLTGCCGQHLCASCLTRWLGTQLGWRQTCPHCRQKIQYMADKAIVREVNEFKIYCTNHKVGCVWVGKLGELSFHLNTDNGCGYVMVTCTNKECSMRVSRKDLQIHLQQKCSYRLYQGEYCGHMDTYTAITSLRGHYSWCSEYPLECPNMCGVVGIRRRSMPDHHCSCPLEPLDCPFKDAGCTNKIARKDMEDHMTENQQKHMLLSFQSLQQSAYTTKQELHTTKQELQTTEQELHTTKQELHAIKQEILATKQELHSIKDWLLQNGYRSPSFPGIQPAPLTPFSSYTYRRFQPPPRMMTQYSPI